MAVRVFFLNKLHENVDPSEYERWIREVDYPVARSLPAIQRYEVTRLGGLVQGVGELPCDYLEVIEITDIEAYRASLSGGPEIESLFAEWSTYVAESVAVYGEVI